MQDSVPGLILGVIVGIFIGALTVVPRTELAEAVKNRGLAGPEIDWRIASLYDLSRDPEGVLAGRLAARVDTLSDGAIRLSFAAPDALVPDVRCLDAVGTGHVDGCWSQPDVWARTQPALALFGAAPFGPSARELVAWLDHGGGGVILDKVYARHGAKALICGIAAPAAAGWFDRRVLTVADFAGLRVNADGLEAKVLSALGAEPRVIAPGDLEAAVESGAIAGTLADAPAADAGRERPPSLKHYAFPGWQRQAAPLQLLVNLNAWQALTPRRRELLEVACGDNFRAGLASSEAAQPAALAELAARGAEPYRLAPAALDRLEQAWREVAADEAKADPLFYEAWQSYSAFRDAYRAWDRLGRL